MNSEDFRDALHEHVTHQPPVSPDLRAGVDRKVRRQRLRAVAVASPAVVALLLGGAVLASRGGQDTTLSVAGGTGTTAVTTTEPAPTTVTVPATTGTTAATAPTTEPGAPSSTDPEPAAPASTAAPKDPVSCGQVDVLSMRPSVPMDADGPFACFINAFNARTPTDLTLVFAGPDGGTLTEKLSATADHVLTVTASGSMSMKLPAFNFGGGTGGGGLVPDDSDAGGDCGTITIDLSQPAAAKPDAKVFKCLINAVTGSTSARVTLVMRDAHGGTMTSRVDLSGADRVLTFTMDGTTTIALPETLQVPADVLEALPSGDMGFGGMMGNFGGLGGIGSDDAVAEDWGGWGAGQTDKTDKTDK